MSILFWVRLVLSSLFLVPLLIAELQALASSPNQNIPMVGRRTVSPLPVAQLVPPVRVVPPGAAPRPARIRFAPYTGPVEIRMMVIHATNSLMGYDPSIAQFQRHLSFLNYKGFKLLFQSEMMLRSRTTRSLGLFDGKVIEVTLNSATQEKAELKVRMYHPKVPNGVTLDTTVSVKRRGTFFIGGPQYLDGVLVLPITPWY